MDRIVSIVTYQQAGNGINPASPVLLLKEKVGRVHEMQSGKRLNTAQIKDFLSLISMLEGIFCRMQDNSLILGVHEIEISEL